MSNYTCALSFRQTWTGQPKKLLKFTFWAKEVCNSSQSKLDSTWAPPRYEEVLTTPSVHTNNFFNIYCLFSDKTIKGVKQYFSTNLSPKKHIVLGLLIQHKEPEKSSTISQFTKAYLSCQVLNTLKKYIVYAHMMVPLFWPAHDWKKSSMQLTHAGR
jgi:hypothetical protein